MKCNNTIIIGWKTRASMNKNAPPKVLGFLPRWGTTKHYPYRPPFVDHEEKCGGNITPHIGIEYRGSYEVEALFGDAQINVEFKCDRCGCTNYPKLPNDVDSLNQFLIACMEKL